MSVYNFYSLQLNPKIFTIGPISLYWYGMMYGISLIFSIFYLLYRVKSYENFFLKKDEIENLLYLVFFGSVLGGRIGYLIFYQLKYFLYNNMLWVFKIWEGGMSFHGGLIGAILAIMFFSYKKNINFFQISDFIIPAVPFGLGLGRLGNFINGELWGRVTDKVSWAVLFPNSKYDDLLILSSSKNMQWIELFNHYGALPRHPSQLYEMFLEGIVLFIIINLFVQKSRPLGSVSGLFLFFYGIFRIIVEFFRQPDSHIGLIKNIATMGQILSVPLVIFGSIIIFFSYKRNFY